MRHPNRTNRHAIVKTATADLSIALVALVALTADLNLVPMLAALAATVGSHALVGQLRHLRRTQAFVSPAVAEMLKQHGDAALGTDVTREISVVCADVRNYTAFTAQHSPEQVMQFLRAYYDAAGEVVQAHGAVIKDYAGDGILILVGATQPLADHAERALALAADLRAAALKVTARWSGASTDLGVGVGVASGAVALGMLGGPERLEFAAVGDAVNLAARLCGKAASGQIVMDDATRTQARRSRANAAHLSLKGFTAPVTGYILAQTETPTARAA